MTEPYLKRDAGQVIRASDWNDMQARMREHVTSHTHSGAPDQGARLTGEAIAPEAALKVASVEASDALRVKGKEILEEIDKLAGRFALYLPVVGGTVSTALGVKGSLTVGDSLVLGAWPANSTGYAMIGSSRLVHTEAGNYALLVGTGEAPGRTFLNSPDSVRLRIGNVDKLVVNKAGFVGIGSDAERADVALSVGGDLKVSGTVTIAKQEPWQEPKLENSWVNYGGTSWARAAFMKDSMGFVHLRGLVKDGTFGYWWGSAADDVGVIFRLPPGYRPGAGYLRGFRMRDGAEPARVDVLPDGRVSASGPPIKEGLSVPQLAIAMGFRKESNAWLSLDGIRFLAEK